MEGPPREFQTEDGLPFSQTDACLICGEPWSRERVAEASVLVMAETVQQAWVCHLDCLAAISHASFADFFAKPS